jgi:hypothetical protein
MSGRMTQRVLIGRLINVTPLIVTSLIHNEATAHIKVHRIIGLLRLIADSCRRHG